jgi:hypothetical protein
MHLRRNFRVTLQIFIGTERVAAEQQVDAYFKPTAIFSQVMVFEIIKHIWA